jgi:hypothetical protein
MLTQLAQRRQQRGQRAEQAMQQGRVADANRDRAAHAQQE